MLSWVVLYPDQTWCLIFFNYILSIKQGFCVFCVFVIFNNADLMNLMRMNSKVINVFWNHALSGEYPEV